MTLLILILAGVLVFTGTQHYSSVNTKRRQGNKKGGHSTAFLSAML
jgi:hypothetical protein